MSGRAAGDWDTGYFGCLNMNPAMRLPTITELAAIVRGLGVDEEDWTDNLTDISHAISTSFASFIFTNHERLTSDALGFRCIATPMATGNGS